MGEEKILFLADAHFQPGDRPGQYTGIRDFLSTVAADATYLILLGDTFHCWFERSGRVVGDYQSLLSLFGAASKKGLKIHHVSGNRDFAIGASSPDIDQSYDGFFGSRCGRSILTDHGIEPHGTRYLYKHDGISISCCHGDIFCTRGTGYRFLRQLLQGTLGRCFMGWGPFWIALHAVKYLQSKPACDAYRKPDRRHGIVTASAAKELRHDVDIVCCGHIHCNDNRELIDGDRSGRLFVIPPWVAGCYYGERAGQAVNFKQFSPETTPAADG